MRIVNLPMDWQCEHPDCPNVATKLIINTEDEEIYANLNDEDLAYELWDSDTGIALCDVHMEGKAQ